MANQRFTYSILSTSGRLVNKFYWLDSPCYSPFAIRKGLSFLANISPFKNSWTYQCYLLRGYQTIASW